jgi:hypothetical protein
MIAALFVAASVSSTLAVVSLALSAFGASGPPSLLVRAVVAMLIVEQATLTFLAHRIPALAVLRPVVLVGAAAMGAAALVAFGAIASGGATWLGSIRWLVAVECLVLVAQSALTFAARSSLGSDRTMTADSSKPIS